MSLFSPARGCRAAGSNAPGVVRNDPTSSVDGGVAKAVGDALEKSLLFVLVAGCCVCRPVKTSQTPIL